MIVNDFKNFRGKLSITLCDPHTDSYFLDVIVGRNGSGKSCVLEAIEWCLSSLSARDVRGSNMKDLVNIHSIKASMAVTVEIYCKEEKYDFNNLSVACHYLIRLCWYYALALL